LGITKKNLIESGYLKFKNFKVFLDKYATFKNIELSNWGELFLNPEINKIIKYAYIKKVNLSAKSGVNLNNISEGTIKILVKYKFRNITISIDGTTQQSYKKYRIGGDYNTVINNIKKINYYKSKFNSSYPALTWQFILFGHNIYEASDAEKLANNLNMKFITRLNYNPKFSPIIKKIKKKNDAKFMVLSREEFEKKYSKPYLSPCLDLFFSPQINWNGTLLGCCNNRFDDYGNIFNEGLQKCINNKKYKKIKKLIFGEKIKIEDTFCNECRYFPNNK